MPNKKKSNNKRTKSRPAVKPRVLANNVSPRPNVRPRPKRSALRGSTRLTPKHAMGVCAISNPFCPAAKGSKWPDGTMGNTMVEQFRANRTISTLGTGDTAFVLATAAPFGFMTALSSAAGVVTMNGAYLAYRTNSLLAVNGTGYRITSFGAIIRCVASATTASGIVTLGTVGQNVPISSVITLGTELYDQVVVEAIQPGMEVSWVSQPRGTEARQFVPLSTNLAVTNDWTNLVIEITGAPINTPMLSVEWFINVEFSVLLNNPLTALAPRNPPVVPKATEAVSKLHSSIGSFITGGVKQVEDSFMNHASMALSSILTDPLESIAALFI